MTSYMYGIDYLSEEVMRWFDGCDDNMEPNENDVDEIFRNAMNFFEGKDDSNSWNPWMSEIESELDEKELRDLVEECLSNACEQCYNMMKEGKE